MSSWIRSGTIVAAFLSTIGGVSALGGLGGPGDSARPGVLVELFTSQGCSTCPPADRLLTRLGAEGEGRIVPLAFHVDYWNHDGWSDPFSRHAWSVRQQAYVRRFRLPAEYTPQMVVDGSSQIIGSREADLRAAISAAAARPSARIALGVERSASRLHVAATVDRPAELRGRRLELMVAVFETGFVTKIGSGENGGKLLHDDYVVRSLERGAKIAADAPARTEHSLSLSADRGWDSSRLGVAAFLQDPKTLEVWGASSVPVPSGAPAPGAE